VHRLAYLHQSRETVLVVPLESDHDHIRLGTEGGDAGSERPEHPERGAMPPRKPEALDQPVVVIDHRNAEATVHPA
jgi:hypothetical protein